MDKSEIIKAVIEEEYQISPEAVELIKSSNSPECLLKYVLSTVNDFVVVIGAEHIDLESFAAHDRASKLIHAENKKNPGFENSTEKPNYDEIPISSLKAGEFLSVSGELSRKSDNVSSETGIPAPVNDPVP